MAISTKVSKSGMCLLLGVLGIAGAQLAACSSEFTSCYAHRNCPDEPLDEAGAAGDESGGTSGGEGQSLAGTSGSARAGAGAGETTADSGGAAGAGGGDATSAGESGAPGATPPACATGFSRCSSECIYTDGDPQNCGACNLKCPSGSLCKSSMCEVRVGSPNLFTGNEASAFRALAGYVHALSITVTKQSTLLALGFINASKTAGAFATFGLYADSGSKSPGALIFSVSDVALKSSVQEIAVSNVVLVPGTYYFAVLAHNDGEPTIPVSLSSSLEIDTWLGGDSHSDSLPPNFGSAAAEQFASKAVNVYLVVKQPAG